jgi:tetrahydromethanopterin S-methyltransferase subunit C
MILPIANIVSGFVLAAPKLKTLGMAKDIETAEGKLNRFRGTIGLVILVLGLIALLVRANIFNFYVPYLWSSYPQAIIAILMGLILSMNFFVKYNAIHQRIVILERHAEWIGILGILVGLFALI